MLGRIYAIALTAFREAIRDRILFAVLGLAAASVFLGLGLGGISASGAVRVLVDHGLVTTSLLANLVAIFLGANFLYKELELRTLYVLLARPVSRHELVLGKYAGILLTVTVVVSLTASLVLGLAITTAAEESPAALARATAWAPWLSQLLITRGARLAALVAVPVALGSVALVPRLRRALTLGAVVPAAVLTLLGVGAVGRAVVPEEADFVLRASALVMGETAVVAAGSMFFSAFSTPFVTGMFSVGLFAIARSTWLMQHLPRRFPAAGRAVLEAVARVAPNQHLFVPNREVLVPASLQLDVGRYLLDAMVYAGAYALVFLLAAVALFRRRDLV